MKEREVAVEQAVKEGVGFWEELLGKSAEQEAAMEQATMGKVGPFSLSLGFWQGCKIPATTLIHFIFKVSVKARIRLI